MDSSLPTRRFWGQAVDDLLVSPLRDALIRLEGLSLGMRILAVLGYVVVVLLLIGALVLDVLGTNLPMATWHYTEGPTYAIPHLALGTALFGLTLGWAYLLAAATEDGRRLFYPLLLFFLIDIVWVVSSNLETMVLGCLFVPPILGVGIAYFFTYRKPFWRAWPLLKFAVVLLAMALLLFFYWAGTPDESSLVVKLRTVFILLSWVATLFWVLSGLALVDMTIKVARWLGALLQRFLSPERLRVVAAAVVCVHPLPALLAFFLAPRGTLLRPLALGDGVVAVLVFLFGLVLLAGRRWDLRNARLALTLSLVAPVFGLGMALALRGIDLSTLAVVAVQSTNTIPPLLLFVVVMAYNIFGLMAGFANTEGKAIPRRARILLCFGAALLIIAFAVFFVNVRLADSGELDQSFQDWTNNIFALSVVLLGLPYLVWVIWKRRERLTGEIRETPAAATPGDPR